MHGKLQNVPQKKKLRYLKYSLIIFSYIIISIKKCALNILKTHFDLR